MTLVSEIITDAYRQSNLLAIGVSPTTPQTTEGLRYLNRLVKSVFGNEVGDPLVGFPMGADNIVRPAGYPWYGNEPGGDWFVPKNYRLVTNLTAAISVYLHPAPDDGTRFAVSDAGNSLATYPVTVYGNGRLIETVTSITLNTNGLDSEWFYRADLANWSKYAPLIDSDTFPFPEEFDDFFITMLAIRLNPSYGISLDAQSNATLARSGKQLRARYTQNIPTPSEIGLLRMSRMAYDRDLWRDGDWPYDDNNTFNKGWPW